MFTVEFKLIHSYFGGDINPTSWSRHILTYESFEELMAFIQSTWVDNWIKYQSNGTANFYQIATGEWRLEQQSKDRNKIFRVRFLKNDIFYPYNSPWKIGLCSQYKASM